MQDDWALIVGINSYPKAGVNPLEGAVHDAKAFYRWVTDPQGGDVPSGGGNETGHAMLLTSPDPAPPGLPHPLFSDISRFFENLMYELGNATGRRLYVYLSGHGISPTGQESVRNAALLMADATPPDRWSNFPGNVWAEGARSAARFHEVVLIMDCCRDLKQNARITYHNFGDPVADSRDCRLIEAYATEWASKARELPFPPDNQKQGVFTHSLLEVLKSGRMSGTVLKNSVIRHLELAVENQRRTQMPQIDPDDDLANVYFNEKAEEARTSVTLKGHDATPPRIEHWPENADHSVPATLDDWCHDGTSWRGTLEPGFYELRLPSGGGRRLNVLAGVPEEVTL